MAMAVIDGFHNPHSRANTIRAFVQSGFNDVATHLTARRNLTEPSRFANQVMRDS